MTSLSVALSFILTGIGPVSIDNSAKRIPSNLRGTISIQFMFLTNEPAQIGFSLLI